jgi:segregation and condensation protein B
VPSANLKEIQQIENWHFKNSLPWMAIRPMELTTILESLLFACQEPLPIPQMITAVKETAKDLLESQPEGAEDPVWLVPLVKVNEAAVQTALNDLIQHYEKDGRAFTLTERPGGWRLCARAEYADWCRALFPGKKVQRLSQPALETLAIIAYRQPITKAGIEAVRGVSVDAMVQQLVERRLIRIEGRAELPGKPLLYGTTEAFLEHFSVRNVDELPNARELRQIKLPTGEETPEPEATQLSLEPTAEAAQPE